ncbi:hypothetical protein [Demequina aurantiaca]|uniref:hypothetical protein n=1 Tax=Demequina aurantiaca TaxID=676200 RepID=UPI003D358712
MPMPMTALSRLGRAVTGAALATFVALASHVIAGGVMPSTPGIAVPLLISAAVCFQLAGKELSLWRICVAVLASQWLFHQLFMLGAGDVGLNTTGGIHAGHDVGSITVSGGAHAFSGGGMTFSHAIAALVTIAAIFKAEQLFAALATVASWVQVSIRAAVLSRLHHLSATPKVVACATEIPSWRRTATPLDAASSPISGRGPPLLAG